LSLVNDVPTGILLSVWLLGADFASFLGLFEGSIVVLTFTFEIGFLDNELFFAGGLGMLFAGLLLALFFF
jgi:hypothetical protein